MAAGDNAGGGEGDNINQNDEAQPNAAPETQAAEEPETSEAARLREAAVAEKSRYAYGMVIPGNANAMAEMMKDKSAITTKLSSDGLLVQGTPVRLFWYDSCVHADCSEPFRRDHSGYMRRPGIDVGYFTQCVECTASLFDAESDVLGIPTCGQKKVTDEIKKLTSKHAFEKDQILTVIYTATDMKSRYDSGSEPTKEEEEASQQNPCKKRKVVQKPNEDTKKVSWLNWANGPSEEIHFYTKAYIAQPERERLTLKTPGYDTTAMPFIPNVPLNTPQAGNVRPLVAPQVKKDVLAGMETVSLLGDGPEIIGGVIGEQGSQGAKVPLFHHGRHLRLLQEVLHQVNAHLVVDYTGGDGGMMKACILSKVPCLVWFKNAAHKAAIEEEVLSWLMAGLSDPSNERFFLAETATVQEQTGKNVD